MTPSLIALCAPPLVGAFIGYMTNHVAIRMLFRPLKPWRILGLRVPLTPGVIPSKRQDLAKNIGEMVGTHLLTSQDIKRALDQAGFQKELRELISSKVVKTLQKDLGPLPTLIPSQFKAHFEAGVKILRWRFLKHLHNHLAGEAFRNRLTSTVSEHLGDFLDQSVDSRLPADSRENLYRFAEQAIDRLLAGDEVEAWIKTAVTEKLQELRHQERSLKELLPEELTTLIMARLEAATPSLLEKLAGILQEPAMQEKIAKALGNAATGFAANLGPMAALLGNFLNPESIAEKILTYLREKGGDISSFLLDDKVQEQLAAILREKADLFLDRPVRTILEKVDQKTFDEISTGLCKQVTETIRRPATAAMLAGFLRTGLENQTDRPLRELLLDIFGAQGLRNGLAWVTAEVSALLGSTGVKRMLDNLVTDLLDQKLLSQPIGPLADFLPKAVVEGIDDFLVGQIRELLIREVPGLVESLNIKSVVTKKVDSLDLLRLEGLLLSIMQEQFKYINLFGGLLGFIIGLANLIFLTW